MNVAYIIAPYGAPTKDDIERNIQRALILAGIAVEMGYAPIVQHAYGAAIYGSERGEQNRTLAVRAREMAIEAGCTVAAAVGKVGGAVFVLLDEDEHLTSGSQEELDAFIEGGGTEAFYYDSNFNDCEHDVHILETT